MNKKIALSTLAALFTTGAQAEVRINGFANIVGGITSSDDSLYGYDDDTSFSPDSLFALQISGDIAEGFTATAQLVSRGADDYEAEMEWAYLTYEVSDTTSISAGRFVIPLFRYSASEDIAYSFHWVAVPQSVYDVPFNNLEGAKVSYNNYVGDWEYGVELLFGTYDESNDVFSVEGNNVFAATFEATYESFKARAVYGRANSTLNVGALDPILAGVQGAADAGLISQGMVDDLVQEDDTGEFIGLGLEYDAFDWFVAAEFTEVITNDAYNPDDSSFYVTAGFRSGKWTPSITYEQRDSDEENLAALYPEVLQPGVTVLETIFADDESAINAAIRYDIDTNIALKADVTRFTDDLREDMDATLVRFAVNYVF